MQITCPICGRVDDPEDYIINSPIRKIMEEKGVCFHCAFWYNIKEGDMEDPDLGYDKEVIEYLEMEGLDTISINHRIPVVVNRTHWYFYLENPILHIESRYSYMEIPNMKYILFEDGRVVKTNGLYCQGTVPKPFYKLIPNNAVFISLEEFDQISNHISNRGKSHIETTCPQPLLNFLLKKYEFTK